MDKALLSFCSLLVIASNGVDGGTQKLLCVAHILSLSQEHTYMAKFIPTKMSIYTHTTYHVVNIQLKMAS